MAKPKETNAPNETTSEEETVATTHEETIKSSMNALWNATRTIATNTETVLRSGIELAVAANRAATTEMFRQTETLAAITRPFVETTRTMNERFVGIVREQTDRTLNRSWW